MDTSTRVPTTIITGSVRYEAGLQGGVTVGQLAHYLSALMPGLETSTLEWAQPIPAARRLHWFSWQPGDRLVIRTSPPRGGVFPTPVRPGDQIVQFAANGFAVSSGGKRTLIVGKPDFAHNQLPDVDLRLFFSPQVLNYISRNCLNLTYDPREQTWFISRTGHTRIWLDDLAVNKTPVPLNATQRLRFYRATADPTANQPLGEIAVSIATNPGAANANTIQLGAEQVSLILGIEHESVLLQASASIQADQIIRRLLAYHQIQAQEPAEIYHLRLIRPEAPLDSLDWGDEAFLYAAQTQQDEASALHLVDVHDRARQYTIQTSQTDRAVQLGWRADGQPAQDNMDIDLLDAVVGAAMLPFDVMTLLRYRANEETWWVVPVEQSGAAVFINNTRLGRTPLRLTTGDVLSFGMSVSHYFARFEVQITNQEATKL